MAALFCFALICAANGFTIETDSQQMQTLISGKPVLALHQSQTTNELFVYTDKERLRVTATGEVSVMNLLDKR